MRTRHPVLPLALAAALPLGAQQLTLTPVEIGAYAQYTE